MFASNSKPNGNTQSQTHTCGFNKGWGRNSSNRGRGGERYNNNNGG